jgi:hypothetical protein
MGQVIRARHRFLAMLWGLALLWTMLALASPRLALATSLPPLPESDYTTHGACSAPVPGRASCMALELVPHTSAARARAKSLTSESVTPENPKTVTECAAAFPSACLTPQNLRSAYFPAERPEAPASNLQTIALIDAYNDPKAEADLGVYDKEFALPAIHACSGIASGCLEQVGQSGTATLPFPKNEVAREAKEAVCVSENGRESLKKREEACNELIEAEGWAVEISTDIEVTHAICQNCKILLVEASTPSYPDLEAAEETAVRLGATEISNSWGGPQEGSGQAFNHPGTVITAAAGDDGYLNWTEAQAAAEAKSKGEASGYFVGADYPAASPDVVAVGGTKLTLANGARQSESVWNEDPDAEGKDAGAGGGGCSESFSAPTWQQAVPDWSQVGCGSKRAVADVSADADPYSGVAVYDSVPTIQEEAPGEVVNTPLEWWPIGGTSVASPIIASMFALAGGAHGVAYPAQTLYSHLATPLLYDVTTGGNGDCDANYLSCTGSMEPLSPLDCGEAEWICNATAGYDGPTGVGSPKEIGAFSVGEEATQQGKPGEEADKSKSGGSESAGNSSGGSKESTTGSSGTGSEGGTQAAGGATGPTGTTSNGSSSPAGPGGTSTGTRPSPSLTATHTSPAPRISSLALTLNARTALRHSHLRISSLAFSCTLSRAATIRLTLAIQVHSGGHTHWRALHTSLTFSATDGANRRRLRGSRALAPGLYRLTLTPAGGTPRSITLHVS